MCLTNSTETYRFVHSLFLQEYNLDVKHISGKQNLVADALSHCWMYLVLYSTEPCMYDYCEYIFFVENVIMCFIMCIYSGMC